MKIRALLKPYLVEGSANNMGHHINKSGNFQSDKYPKLPENKFLLSFKDPIARKALRMYAENSNDKELADDILEVLKKFE